MPKKISKLLVIDASVARAAGGRNAISPTSKACRDFLDAVLEICYRMVMTPELREEWDKHQSSVARKWRKTMIAKKKLKPRKDIPRNNELWDVFAKLAETDKQREEIFKDLHLLEAALNTDRTIISLDDNTARNFFSAGSDKFEQIKCIVWVNPDKLEETPIEWLENGAPAEDERMLGFWKKNMMFNWHNLFYKPDAQREISVGSFNPEMASAKLLPMRATNLKL